MTSVAPAAQKALEERLAAAVPTSTLRRGRAPRLEQNILECMTVGQMRAATDEVAQGDGGELKPGAGDLPPPLHSAYSSAALAVNSFACWRGFESQLDLAGVHGFTGMAFERKFPIFDGPRAPNLDVVFEGPNDIVAVESKCTEHLSPKEAKFSAKYDDLDLRNRMHPSWRELLETLGGDARAFRLLDAGQLVKHYLGLTRTLGTKSMTLVYLFWEPENSTPIQTFLDHRAEVARFSDAVSSAPTRFVALSYPELWADWSSRAEPGWLGEHVEQLRARYSVSL